MRGELAARGDAELGVDVAEVERHGPARDEERRADLLVGHPLRHEPRDGQLLPGQAQRAARRGRVQARRAQELVAAFQERGCAEVGEPLVRHADQVDAGPPLARRDQVPPVGDLQPGLRQLGTGAGGDVGRALVGRPRGGGAVAALGELGAEPGGLDRRPPGRPPRRLRLEVAELGHGVVEPAHAEQRLDQQGPPGQQARPVEGLPGGRVGERAECLEHRRGVAAGLRQDGGRRGGVGPAAPPRQELGHRRRGRDARRGDVPLAAPRRDVARERVRDPGAHDHAGVAGE